jgi:hypothetical protein
MKRRAFIRRTAALGIAGTAVAAGAGYSSSARRSPENRFDIHPFVREHPEAVFLIAAPEDGSVSAHEAGLRLSRELVTPADLGGFHSDAKVNLNSDFAPAVSRRSGGLRTAVEPDFVGGFASAMRELGPKNFFIRGRFDSTLPGERSEWESMAARNLIDFRAFPDAGEGVRAEDGDVIVHRVPRGVVFREIAYRAPMNEAGSFLVTFTRFRADETGVSGAVSALLGMTNAPFGGVALETRAHLLLDNLSIVPTALNIVAGVGGDGREAAGRGMTVFGADPLRVDLVACRIAGREPGNVGFFRLAIERGLSDVLDPIEIPLYSWKQGRAERIALDSVPRTAFPDCRDRTENRSSPCDGPFDYLPWKSAPSGDDSVPEIAYIGLDRGGGINFSLTTPGRGIVRVEVLGSGGKTASQLLEGTLDSGAHHAVWTPETGPGRYVVRARGNGWEVSQGLTLMPA